MRIGVHAHYWTKVTVTHRHCVAPSTHSAPTGSMLGSDFPFEDVDAMALFRISG
jgi:hypothetical protein